MKKYSIGLYAKEINKEEARRFADKAQRLGRDFEGMIADICMEDVTPDVKFGFETKEAAVMAMNDSVSVYKVETTTRPILYISCVMTEEYEEDEDGDYRCGGDFDRTFKATQEQKDIFNEFIGREAF